VIAIYPFAVAARPAKGSRSIKVTLADGDGQSIQVSRFRGVGTQTSVDTLGSRFFKNASGGSSASTPRWG